MTPDSLLVTAGLLGDVDLTQEAQRMLEAAAYELLRSGVRYSPAEYSALSRESQRALRSARKRMEQDSAEAVAEALMAKLTPIIEAFGAESADAAAKLLGAAL